MTNTNSIVLDPNDPNYNYGIPRKSIHFILPAGGVRGSFQAGFMYELFTKYRKWFTVYRIDGTSVGSINGITSLCGEFEVLKELWCSMKNINDFFSKWSTVPVIGKLKSLFHGFYNNGVYNNKLLNTKLKTNLTNHISTMGKADLDKFACVVTDVDNGNSRYIFGSDPHILEYITASASPWIISNPKTIDGVLYTDGALLETYPIKNVNPKKVDHVVIVGFDQEIVQFEKPDTSNMLYYLAALLDISRFHSENSLRIKELVKSGKCIPITNMMTAVMDNFNQETIVEGFEQGQRMATLFYKTYLNKFTENL